MAQPGPLAREDGLLVEELDGELLIYDEQSDSACRLNAAAALVWRSCDGTRTVSDLVEAVAPQLGDVADENLVLIALDTLFEHGLIVSGYESRDSFARRLSRRRFFGRVGVAGAAAMAAPVVYSMAIPSPAAASSLHYDNYPPYTA